MAFMLGNHQFMANSLERLADNLPADKFTYTSKVFEGKKLALMKKKGVYPYGYIDSFQQFGEQQLPLKESFYNILSDEGIGDDYFGSVGFI